MNKQAQARKIYTEKRIVKAQDYLGSVCKKCSSSNDLHFHHRDPKTKVKAISTAIMAECWSWKRLQPELDKCDLLCADCHRSVHRSKYECGTPQKYWRGCRCKPCTAANSKHSYENKNKAKLKTLI